MLVKSCVCTPVSTYCTWRFSHRILSETDHAFQSASKSSQSYHIFQNPGHILLLQCSSMTKVKSVVYAKVGLINSIGTVDCTIYTSKRFLNYHSPIVICSDSFVPLLSGNVSSSRSGGDGWLIGETFLTMRTVQSSKSYIKTQLSFT